MSLEEKLRRVAGWSGLLVAALGLVVLLGGALEITALSFLPPRESPFQPLVSLGFALAGVSLWLQSRPPSARAGAVCAGLVVLLAAARLAEEVFFSQSIGALPAHPTPGAGASPLHTVYALAAAGFALLCLRQRQGHLRWPVSAWLASALIAVATTGLLQIGLLGLAEQARPIGLGAQVSVVLLLLGVGTLLARPRDRHIRILFAPTGVGVLARRLMVIATLAPIVGTGLLVATLPFHLFDLPTGVLLLTSALIVTGFALALVSVDAAGGLDDSREDAEQARLLLMARLQEQAAQLQETVAVRTNELHEVNASLRVAADANASLALVAHHTTNPVIITDAEGRLKWVNTAFERLTGYILTEITDQQPESLLQGPATDPAALAQLHDARTQGAPCKVELLIYTKQRRPFWQIVDLQPVRDSTGHVVKFISVQTDVTEQRAAVQRQHALTERLKLATRAAALGVWEWDAVAHKTFWDDRTLDLYGFRREDYNGTHDDWIRRLHPEDSARAQAAFRTMQAGANELEQEFRIIRADDGAVRHIQSRAIVQRDETGTILRVTGTERDITAEREATRQAELLNERLRLALRSSNYGVWELDAATGRLTWDDRMLELYELTRAEFDGDRTRWISRLHPDDRATAAEYARRVIAGEEPAYDTEFRILRPDGSVRHIESHGHLQRDATGHPLRLVGLNRDITAERQVLAALDLAEQRWQLAVEGSNDSVWDWNIENGVVFHDRRWSLMLGNEPQDIDGTVECWKQLAHPDDRAANEAALQEHFAQRTPFYLHEHRVKAKNGEWKWILERGKVVTRAPDGRPLRMAGTHTDITASKHLEQRLRQVEELFDQVSRLALIGGWEIDLETSQLTWSSGLRLIHEVDDAFQPTLETTLAFYPAEARETMRAALHVARTEGTPLDLELPLLTAQGRPIWVRVLGKVELENGRAVRLHGAMQDITAQHSSEEARRQLEMQLFQAQKMETLGTLAGGIAHDFNNLLTGIIGYHELAADSVPVDNPAQMFLTEARHASLRARELVEQILTFGRQSAAVEHGSLDLTVVLEEARRFLRATLPAMINIDLQLGADCGHVLGDATQIHQVLLNLGSNAAHAMRQHGGTLKITLAPAEVGPEQASTLGGLAIGTYACLHVSDTGHGMDESTRRRIFDPFFTTKNSREGTGLGLAVVHGIVRAHRGAIAVDSTPGIGTTFHVYLPLAATENQQTRQDSGVAPRGTGELICVVDDEEIVGSCTKLVLESKGYRTTIFGSAEECLAALTAEGAECGVLLTDQTMPGMQGTELAATVRKIFPNLPVVLMSGYFSKISAEALDELGQVELLAKPFTTDELAHAVSRALQSTQIVE